MRQSNTFSELEFGEITISVNRDAQKGHLVTIEAVHIDGMEEKNGAKIGFHNLRRLTSFLCWLTEEMGIESDFEDEANEDEDEEFYQDEDEDEDSEL